MKVLLKYLFLLVFSQVSAQNNGDFSVEFGYQKRMFDMHQLNRFLTTPESYNPYLYLTPPNDRIDNGHGFSLAIKYQPTQLIDFGLYGGYQFGKIQKDVHFYLIDNVNMDTTIFDGNYKMTAHAFTGGGVVTYHLNKQFKFHEKEGFLHSFLLSIEARMGFGYTYLHDVIYFDDDIVFENSNFGHHAWSGHGEVALKVGYPLSKNPLFSSLGLNVGYQYLASSKLRNNNGHFLGQNDIQPNLDFSGLFFGVQLTVGK